MSYRNKRNERNERIQSMVNEINGASGPEQAKRMKHAESQKMLEANRRTTMKLFYTLYRLRIIDNRHMPKLTALMEYVIRIANK
jgi:hypothetical protein